LSTEKRWSFRQRICPNIGRFCLRYDPNIPSKPEIEVNAYIYNLGRAGALCVAAEGDNLTYVPPFAYIIRQDGSLRPIDDSPIIETAYAENAVPVMMIANFEPGSNGSELAHTVLSNEDTISNCSTISSLLCRVRTTLL
jgi:spore germination protein